MEALAVRFVLGGLIVSAFAAVGEVFKPKSFAGMFGAAPSVALATLGLSMVTNGPDYAATQCREMILGAAALVVYSAACAMLVTRPLPVWAAAALCWIAWLIASFGLWIVVHWLDGAP